MAPFVTQTYFTCMSHTQIWQLVARELSGEAELSELKTLEQLLQQDPELAYKVELYRRYFSRPPMEVRRSEEAKEQSLEQFRQRFQQAFPVPPEAAIESLPLRRYGNFGSGVKKWMAAAVVVVAGSLFFVASRNKGGHKEIVTVQQSNEVNTMPGSRSKTVLPDGTIVWLNSDSRIVYNPGFGDTKREITLIGEAFFDVAHNAEVPLVVHAKTVNILVKGTAFNVRSYPESETVQTSLIRGAVELTTKAHPEQKIMLRPNEKITIVVNEDKDSGISTTTPVPVLQHSNRKLYQIDTLKESSLADVIPEVSWVENQLVFDNELFTDVIDKMEKWYNVDIVLTNTRLENKRFSGVFEKENVVEALTALQIINPFYFEIRGRTIIIK